MHSADKIASELVEASGDGTEVACADRRPTVAFAVEREIEGCAIPAFRRCSGSVRTGATGARFLGLASSVLSLARFLFFLFHRLLGFKVLGHSPEEVPGITVATSLRRSAG
jgi:hypothetical protein